MNHIDLLSFMVGVFLAVVIIQSWRRASRIAYGTELPTVKSETVNGRRLWAVVIYPSWPNAGDEDLVGYYRTKNDAKETIEILLQLHFPDQWEANPIGDDIQYNKPLAHGGFFVMGRVYSTIIS